GHGSMNDGTTSTFIFNYDAIQFGAPVGVDGVEPKPLMTLQNTPVTLPNGAVIPRGLYVDNASIGYLTADKIYATSLSSITATIGLFKSSATGKRVEISDDGFRLIDENNVARIELGDF
ncbi:hypothetical protein RJU01_20145, partial [Acinetobacter baumannii]|nr:hypothetical protein [Acinetobacter baumannii]